MAFGVKYRMDWEDRLGEDQYRLDIEADGYVGSIIGLGHALDGFELTYNESDWVIGFEGVFSFHIEDVDTLSYDTDLMEAEYQSLKVKFYINSALKNVGWAKPENTVREYIGPHVLYKVSFTDAINDLENIDYVNSTGSRDTLLAIIKRALSFGGIDDLDLFLQCNLFEDILMTETESLFKTFTVPDGAFYDIRDGEKVLNNCYVVLEKCIKSFYCRLAQVNGYWQITNGQEYSSQRDIYAFSNLAAVSENQAYNREVDINDFEVTGSKGELTKIPPVRILKIIHKNKNIGTNEISNSGFDSGTANWNNGGVSNAWTVFNVSGGELIVSDNTGTGDPNENKSFYSDVFNIADIGEGEGFFHWRFKLKLDSIQYSVGNYNEHPPYLKVRITYPDATFIETTFIRILEGESIYELPFAENYPVSQVGDYFITIFYVNPESGTLDLIQLNFDDIEVTQNATTSEPNDRSYYKTSDTPGNRREEIDLYFADGSQASDAGVLMQGSSFSSSWTRYGFSGEGELLVSQFSKQYLNDKKGYFDRITIEGLIDYDEEIHFNSILLLNSKKYRFIEFSKNYKTKQVSGTLQQVDNGVDVTVETSKDAALLSQYGIPLHLIRRGLLVPGATATIPGLVTTMDQSFAGIKEFLDGLKLPPRPLGKSIDGFLENYDKDLYFTSEGTRSRLVSDGLDWKIAANGRTTENITLSGEQEVDGVVTSESRILVMDQTDRSENGIYTSSAGAWTRVTDLSNSIEFEKAAVEVPGGTIHAGTTWRQILDVTTVDTSPVIWKALAKSSSSVETVIIFVPSAEIKALNTIPKTLIAASGSGKFIQVIAVHILLDYGTVAYSDEILEIEYATGQDITSFITPFLNQTADTIVNINVGDMSIYARAQVENSAVRLKATNADPITGDGDLTITIFYRTVTI